MTLTYSVCINKTIINSLARRIGAVSEICDITGKYIGRAVYIKYKQDRSDGEAMPLDRIKEGLKEQTM
jgi:hypothetical protein